MAQITDPTYPQVGGSDGQWGALLNALLGLLVQQGNASDAVLAVLQETIRDVVGATLQPGTGVTIAVDDGGDKITITATQLTSAQIDTVVAGLIRDTSSTTRAALNELAAGAPETYFLLTESGDFLTTESGDFLVTQ